MKRTLLILALVLTCLIPVPAKADTGITDVYLYGPGGNGGTVTIAPIVTTNATLGTTAGAAVLWQAQSFSIDAGILNQITIPFGPSTGAPAGTVTYYVTADNISIPGTTLTTGTFTPVANANTVLNVSAANVFVSANTTYWVFLQPTAAQANGNFWTVKANTTNGYSNGFQAQTANGTAWTIQVNQDLQLTINTVAGSAPADTINDKLAQSFTVGQATTVSAIKLFLKKSGAPTGTLTLTVESDAGNMPSGSVAVTGATVTLAESSLTTSYALTTFTFSNPLVFRPGITYWIDLTTNRTDSTVYVLWGATGACTGTYFRNHVNSAWQLENNVGVFSLTISSLSPPQASQDFVTLTDGAVGTVNYSITGGEAGLFGLGIIFLIVMIFGIFRLRKP